MWSGTDFIGMTNMIIFMMLWPLIQHLEKLMICYYVCVSQTWEQSIAFWVHAICTVASFNRKPLYPVILGIRGRQWSILVSEKLSFLLSERQLLQHTIMDIYVGLLKLWMCEEKLSFWRLILCFRKSPLTEACLANGTITTSCGK